MKDFLKKNKKAILNLLLLLLCVVAISLVSFGILMALDIVRFENGGMRFHLSKLAAFTSAWYGWIFFIGLQVILSMLLCVIPGASMAFILLSQTIYTVPWQAFLLCFASVMIASAAMYAAGRFGGYRICVKFLGKNDCERALSLLRNKGTVYFPFMMLFPFFPDEALVMVAGTMKMKLLWFIPSIVVGRGIGIASIVFGLSSVPFEKFTTPFHWIGFVLLCALVVAAVLWFASRFNRFMEQKRLANEQTVSAESIAVSLGQEDAKSADGE